MIRQAADDVLCCAVRQATDDGLDLLPVNFLMSNKGGERCWCEMGENFIHLFAGVGVCHKCCYFNIGVILSQSNKVSARITGGANDGSSDDLVRGLVGHAGGSFWVLCSMRSLLFFCPRLAGNRLGNSLFDNKKGRCHMQRPLLFCLFLFA